MRTSGFWRHFEEATVEAGALSSSVCGTQTRQREEEDQRNACISLETKTVTNTREEADQDVRNSWYRAVPTRFARGETFTKQQEETDQDESSQVYGAMPRQCPGRTKTLTEQREEGDQDRSGCGYGAIPAKA